MLTVTRPAASHDLTTLAAVKTAMEVTGTDDDAFLAHLITRASDTIRAWCNRVFSVETVRETLRLDRYRPELVLIRFPVVSIASVTVGGTALDAADYEADSTHGVLYRLVARGKFMCWPSDVVVVEYSAGYVLPGNDDRTLPHDIEAAALALVRSSYHIRDRDPSLKSVTLGSTAINYQSGAETMPPDVALILSAHRQPAVG